MAVLSSWTEHHTAITEYTLLGTHGTLTKTDHFLGHKASINTFQRIEINRVCSSQLQLNHKSETKRLPKISICLFVNNSWIRKGIKIESILN